MGRPRVRVDAWEALYSGAVEKSQPEAAYEQQLAVAKKAIERGEIEPTQTSVMSVSKCHPSTAHAILMELVRARLLKRQSGGGFLRN